MMNTGLGVPRRAHTAATAGEWSHVTEITNKNKFQPINEIQRKVMS